MNERLIYRCTNPKCGDAADYLGICPACDHPTRQYSPTVAAPPKPIPFTTAKDNGATVVLVDTPFGMAKVTTFPRETYALVEAPDGRGQTKRCWVHDDVESWNAVVLCHAYGEPNAPAENAPTVDPFDSPDARTARRWAVRYVR